jgi:tetratricopeptide (TPR) repeat protein
MLRLAKVVAASWCLSHLWVGSVTFADEDDTDTGAGPVLGPQTTAEEIVPANRDLWMAERASEYTRFMRLFSEKRYPQAAAAGLRVVELTRQIYGDQQEELISPLNNLATAQHQAGDLIAAGDNYRASIALIERFDGVVAKRLINPLLGLGVILNRAGAYEDAVESFGRALKISHINEGFYNLEQLKIRDGLTESYIGLNDFESANFEQQNQVYVHERKLGFDNPEIVPSLYKLARWYGRTGQLASERLAFQNAIRILTDAHGKESTEVIDALRGIASTHRRELMDMSAGLNNLKKALRIVDGREEPDPLLRGTLLVEMGDIYNTFDRIQQSTKTYTEAWQEFAKLPDGAENIERYFGDPVRIRVVPIARQYPTGSGAIDPASSPDAFRDGFVALRYIVNDQGRVEDVTVIESDPPDLDGFDQKVASRFSKGVYRPRFSAEGEPAVSPEQVYRHEFKLQLAAMMEKDDPGSSEKLAYPDGQPIAYPDSEQPES